ncbi:MAG: hypothetical protein K5872_22330 [Rhizobiaceae bacterium]|nr:hypothetical protein [Rhizobiaceae bacterium]
MAASIAALTVVVPPAARLVSPVDSEKQTECRPYDQAGSSREKCGETVVAEHGSDRKEHDGNRHRPAEACPETKTDDVSLHRRKPTGEVDGT